MHLATVAAKKLATHSGNSADPNFFPPTFLSHSPVPLRRFTRQPEVPARVQFFPLFLPLTCWPLALNCEHKHFVTLALARVDRTSSGSRTTNRRDESISGAGHFFPVSRFPSSPAHSINASVFFSLSTPTNQLSFLQFARDLCLPENFKQQ